MTTQDFWDKVYIGATSSLLSNAVLTPTQNLVGHFDNVLADAKLIADRAVIVRDLQLKNNKL